MAEEKDEKTNKPTIQQSTTSSVNPTSIIKNTISHSTSNLLSAEYNPSHNPKKDELVQSASIRILEVESLLDKLNTHIDKHHRQSSQKLQDFEQIHTELSKIQSTLMSDEKTIKQKQRNKPSIIDPYIIIAPNNHHDDNKNMEDEKDDEKDNTDMVHNATLTTLEPFQKLVNKIQKEIDPNHTDNNNNNNNNNNKRRSSIKMKKSELDSIHYYVNEHRNKMKEKTYQYEEKKKQLLSAKERLNKAKARFKKRLNKSKQKSDRRNRAYSENKRQTRFHNKHHNNAISDITSPRNYNKAKFRIINESQDMDKVNNELSLSKTSVSKLSAANLNKLNCHNGSVSDTYTGSDSNSNSKNNNKVRNYNSHNMQASAPLYLQKSHSPRSPEMGMISGGYNSGHYKNSTNSSVASAFSTISDQSFVDDFHSITAELENIDDIVRNQVKSPSMTSIFSDLVSTPKQSPNTSVNNTPNNGPINGNKKSPFTFNDNHVKNNISSISGDSESNNTKNIRYCSSVEIETDSLQSDLFHLQDIENQIGDL